MDINDDMIILMIIIMTKYIKILEPKLTTQRGE